VDRDVGSPMDALPLQTRQPAVGIAVHVDRHARRGLAGLVQARRLRCTHFDPRLQNTGQVADRQSRLVHIRETTGKRQAFGVFQAIREHARQHVLGGFGGVLGHAQRQRFVDAAVRIRQADRKNVNRRCQGHGAWVSDACDPS
jgi:hypothetical protein